VEWLPRLAGRSFHVRFHRRGSRHALRSPDVAVIVIDTIDDRAGVSLWTREDLARHRLLRPD
jgi:tRNA(Ser,Leu) C12 N-acetylase TAN1